jgi:multiple sugar transport system permease protein
MKAAGARTGVVTYLWLALLGVLFVAPLVWMVSTSLKSPTEMASQDLDLLPSAPTLRSYETILSESQTPVFQWFVNSLLAATLQTALILITASMAAYALARMQFPGRRLMTGVILVTLFVPPVALVIPNYVIVAQLQWLDTLTAVVVPGAAGAFGVFFLRQFFLSLPKELEEAALIDGAGRLRVFLQVILPLSKPALATLALLSFLTNWNDFLWPLYVLFSPEKLTLQPGLSTLNSAFATDYPTIMAGGVVASVPVLLLFVATQRFVVEGVSRSGLKG